MSVPSGLFRGKPQLSTSTIFHAIPVPRTYSWPPPPPPPNIWPSPKARNRWACRACMVRALQFETRASTGLFILAGTAESPCPWREWPAVINGRAHHAVTDTSPTLERSPLYPPLSPSTFHPPTLHYLRSYLSTSVPRTILASNKNLVRHTSQNH